MASKQDKDGPKPRRRSFAKRPLLHSDDDDDDRPSAAHGKRARIANSDTDTDLDMDVDDSRFLPEDDDPRPPKKTTQLASSDGSIGHGEYDSPEGDASLSDDDSEPLPKRAPKTKTKTKAGRFKLTAAHPKPREKEKEILVKDERKLAAPPATTSRASSAAAQSQPSDLFSNDEPADGPPSTKDVLSQPIPKKRKLPPIKKTKTATGTTVLAPPQKPPPPPAQELPKPSLPTSEQRKQALTGGQDVDLTDVKVYAELFKGVGGNMPRSGLKNAEERRKELDRMRDEARGKRAEEAKIVFDLQAQADKIARFEQRLRAENSTVLHPNFLAARFRDEWEQERRHKRATAKEEGEA